MNPLQIKIELPEAVNEALIPPAKGMGETFASLWRITFGWIDNIDKKLQYKRLVSLEKFKTSIESGISNIPPEDLCEPKISVVGPAIEASKYYFEDDIPRQMFANLIINSMNAKKQNLVHRGYVEIIKQMSPEDALVLKVISNRQVIPAASLSIVLQQQEIHAVGTRSIEEVSPFIIVENIVDSLTDQQHSISTDNLRRLGLITLSDYELTEGSAYSFVKSSEDYAVMNRRFDELKANGKTPKHIHVKHKTYLFTLFGDEFCKIVFD